MTARYLMILGATAGAVGAIVSTASPIDATAMLFVAGALFGKGYGVWEEKSKIDSLRADLFAKEIEARGYLRAVGMLQARTAGSEASPDPEMIDAAEANIREDYRAGKISKEQFQKEMLTVVRDATAPTPADDTGKRGGE